MVADEAVRFHQIEFFEDDGTRRGDERVFGSRDRAGRGAGEVLQRLRGEDAGEELLGRGRRSLVVGSLRRAHGRGFRFAALMLLM